MSASGLKHYLPGFDQALNALKEDVTLMANLVIRNLANARAGFAEREEDFSAAVIADDDEVDLLEKQVDRLGTEILIRYQPMITDLRTVLATIKLSNILERASNHAVIDCSALEKNGQRRFFSLGRTRTTLNSL